jgi:hypothetical protein
MIISIESYEFFVKKVVGISLFYVFYSDNSQAVFVETAWPSYEKLLEIGVGLAK